MFWSAVLPFEITFYLLLSIIILVTIFKPFSNWTRIKIFFISFSMAILLFVPSCVGIQTVLNNYRFGKFTYINYSEVKDFSIMNSLPKKAKNITIYSSNFGHHAKYDISKSDLQSHINTQWDYAEKHFNIKPTEKDKEEKIISKDDFHHQFEDINWSVSKNTIELQGPRKRNGAGTTYFYDISTGIAYHSTYYW